MQESSLSTDRLLFCLVVSSTSYYTLDHSAVLCFDPGYTPSTTKKARFMSFHAADVDVFLLLDYLEI